MKVKLILLALVAATFANASKLTEDEENKLFNDYLVRLITIKWRSTMKASETERNLTRRHQPVFAFKLMKSFSRLTLDTLLERSMMHQSRHLIHLATGESPRLGRRIGVKNRTSLDLQRTRATAEAHMRIRFGGNTKLSELWRLWRWNEHEYLHLREEWSQEWNCLPIRRKSYRVLQHQKTTS